MIRKQLEIVNRLGLHARAAAKFVQTAGNFKSEVQVSRNGQEVNGKSIMGVMMLAAAQGSRIELRISGEDEAEAMEALERLVQDRFGEPE